MKTTQKGWGKASGRKAMLLLGMSAMALAFVAVMAGCGDSGGGGGGTPPLPPPQVVAPTASPGAGAVAFNTPVTLSSDTDEADIYYTDDGSTPTISSTPYSSPIEVTAAVTIKAIAVKSGMTNSEVLSAAYTIIVEITASNLDDMKSLIAVESGGASAENPIVVAITIDDASLLSETNTSGSTDTLHKLFDAIPSGKYVAYDLSGCTFTSIGDIVYNTAHARTNKAYLVSITLPDTLISIGDDAFADCIGLISVTIPNSVTSIGDDAFANCSGLTSVTIGNSVTSIGQQAFVSCSGLTSVTIPNSVTSIDGYAFNNCIGLTSVTIPNSVTSIGEMAFHYCIGLTSVYVLRDTTGSLTTLGSDAFTNTNASLRIYVPESVVDAYKGMDNWITYAGKIEAGSPPTL